MMLSVAGAVALNRESLTEKKVKDLGEAKVKGTGQAYGNEVVSFMDHAFGELSAPERIEAANHSILGAKVHRKVAQGYQAKGTMARFFNSCANSIKDTGLEFAAGSIAKHL